LQTTATPCECYDTIDTIVMPPGTRVYYIVEAWIKRDGDDLYGSKSTETSAVVTCDAPTNLTATALGDIGIDLAWDQVANARGYKIYRSTAPTSGFSAIMTIWGNTTTTYSNSNLNCGTTYYYYIVAFVSTIDGSVYMSEASNTVNATPAMGKAVIKTATATSSSSIRLTWNRTDHANGYYVYRQNGSGTYAHIATVSSSASYAIYNDTGLTGNKTYSYKIRAYRIVGSTYITGPMSDALNATTPDASTIGVTGKISATAMSSSSIYLGWQDVPTAVGYYVYRSTAPGGPYEYLRTVSDNANTFTSCTNTGLTSGTTYYYKVRAFRWDGSTLIQGAYSTFAFATTAP
jgi:fibronectin type 3 domain-containing protein